MMTTIEEVEQQITLIREGLKIQGAQLAHLEGKLAELKISPLPCPLEEGKEVRFRLNPEVCKFLGSYYFGARLQVNPQGVIIHIGGLDMDFARKILRAAGNKED